MKLYELWRTLPCRIVVHLEDHRGELRTLDEETRVLPHKYRDCDVFHISPTSSTELTVKIFPPDEA